MTLEWEGFLHSAPDRVVGVIEEGPYPLMEYERSSLTWKDKKLGLMRYKGGDGRGHVTVKHGQRAVVYFDPDFCSQEYQPINIPDRVLARHSDEEVLQEFKKM